MALVALAILAYTYVGYPVLVACLAWVRPGRPRGQGAWEPRVSVLLPVADAAPWLPEKLASLLGQDYPADKLEVLVYADGSRDGGDAIVEDAARRDGRVRLVRGEERRGKPHALNALARLAGGEVLFMTDARQPVSPGAVRELVGRLADPAVGCAAGTLVLRGAAGTGAYWRYESWIRRAEARFRGQVGVSGAIYALRREDLPELPEDTILDDMWIPMRLRLGGRRIEACEGALAYDRAFDDEREFARKVRTLAGNYQLFARMPDLLLPWRNPSWLETVSHKALRLVCPWALLALAAGSVTAGMWALLTAQGAFYALAAAGARAGKPGAVARTFVVLHAAAIAGLWRWAKRAQRIAW